MAQGWAPLPLCWVQSFPHHMVGMGSKANPWDVRVLQERWEDLILPQVPSYLLEKGPKAPGTAVPGSSRETHTGTDV